MRFAYKLDGSLLLCVRKFRAQHVVQRLDPIFLAPSMCRVPVLGTARPQASGLIPSRGREHRRGPPGHAPSPLARGSWSEDWGGHRAAAVVSAVPGAREEMTWSTDSPGAMDKEKRGRCSARGVHSRQTRTWTWKVVPGSFYGFHLSRILKQGMGSPNYLKNMNKFH